MPELKNPVAKVTRIPLSPKPQAPKFHHDQKKDVSSATSDSQALFITSAAASKIPAEPKLYAPSKDCFLYKFPPEIRKEIFSAIVDLFFDEYPERKYLRYTVRSDGSGNLFRGGCKDCKLFAGLKPGLLPRMEIALLPDTKLRAEFLTTRLEKSILKMIPGFAMTKDDDDNDVNSESSSDSDSQRSEEDEVDLGDNIVWPRIWEIPKRIRNSIRQIEYQVDIEGFTDDDMLPYDWMTGLHLAITQLLKKTPWSEAARTSSILPLTTHSELYIPHLRKIILQFPDASREGRGATYETFEEEAFEDGKSKLWSAFKLLLPSAKLQSIEFQDLRDHDIGGIDHPCAEAALESGFGSRGLMDEYPWLPMFGGFTTGLNENLDLEPCESVENHDQCDEILDEWFCICDRSADCDCHCHQCDCGECDGECCMFDEPPEDCDCFDFDPTIYRAISTWVAAKGKYLVWKDVESNSADQDTPNKSA